MNLPNCWINFWMNYKTVITILLKGSASNNDVMMIDLQKELGLFFYGTG